MAILAGLLTTGVGQGALVQASASAPQAAASASAIEAARAAFDALPEADRKALQENLIWTGDYSGMADGTFGRQTFDAIVALQRGARKPPSGILSPWDRKDLQAAAQKAKDVIGFAIVNDPRTGAQIGIPAKILSKHDTNPSGGSRWQTPDGRITLDTRAAPPDATLQSLYERNLAIQAPGRLVTYKVLRPDFFVIAGETSTGKFYTRYASGQPGLRGFSIGYDKTLAPQVDRLVVAIANSFTPFPASMPAGPAAVAQNATPAPQPPQAPPQGEHLIGTGLIVGPRQVVTTAPVEACRDVRVRGFKPQRIMGKDITLLDFTQDLKVQPLTIADGGLENGSPLLIVAFADEDGRRSLSAASGQAADQSAIAAPLQLGASGAPIFDTRGALVGLVGPVPSSSRKVAGIVPAARHAIVPVSDIAKVAPDLTRSGKEPAAQTLSAADIIVSIRQAVVPIVCGQ